MLMTALIHSSAPLNGTFQQPAQVTLLLAKAVISSVILAMNSWNGGLGWSVSSHNFTAKKEVIFFEPSHVVFVKLMKDMLQTRWMWKLPALRNRLFYSSPVRTGGDLLCKPGFQLQLVHFFTSIFCFTTFWPSCSWLHQPHTKGCRLEWHWLGPTWWVIDHQLKVQFYRFFFPKKSIKNLNLHFPIWDFRLRILI